MQTLIKISWNKKRLITILWRKQLPYIYDTLIVCICHCVIALLCGVRSNNVAQQPKQYRRYPPPVPGASEQTTGTEQRKNEQHVKIQHLNPSDRYFLSHNLQQHNLIFILMIYNPLCLHLRIPEIDKSPCFDLGL